MATVNNRRGRECFDLSIMYSRECDLRCPHCMYSAGPDVCDRLDLNQLRGFIATWDNRVSSVGFYGGEVCLHLDAYREICEMLPEGVQRWMFTNGTWSRDPDRAHAIVMWTLRNRVSPMIVSGTEYHRPHQNRTLLEQLAWSMPDHVWLKDDDGHRLPMGRLAGNPFLCTRRCLADQRPTRIAVQPDGSVIFQTCDGVYPIIGHMEDGFSQLAERCSEPPCPHRLAITIKLSRGLCALVDLEDFERLSKYTWYVTCPKDSYYAHTKMNGRQVSMARFILGLTDRWQWVDHISGDALDNRKANLRVVTPQQNAYNTRKKRLNNRGRHPTSKYRGVHWAYGQWRVQIRVNGKVRDVGWFKDEMEAAEAYGRAALEHHGSFARANGRVGDSGPLAIKDIKEDQKQWPE